MDLSYVLRDGKSSVGADYDVHLVPTQVLATSPIVSDSYKSGGDPTNVFVVFEQLGLEEAVDLANAVHRLDAGCRSENGCLDRPSAVVVYSHSSLAQATIEQTFGGSKIVMPVIARGTTQDGPKRLIAAINTAHQARYTPA